MEEIPNVWQRRGYEELSASKIANEVFGHLHAGDQVAVVGRWISGKENKNLKEVVHALKKRGLLVRFITGQTPVQDFCFLINAQKELVVTRKSTYSYWAGFLGKTSKVRRYQVDSLSTRKSSGGQKPTSYEPKIVTLPDNRSIQCEIYASEDVE
jgi:hypothetical protein